MMARGWIFMFLSTTAATPAAPDLDGEVAVVDGASISMVSCFKVYYGYVWYELLRCLRSMKSSSACVPK